MKTSPACHEALTDHISSLTAFPLIFCRTSNICLLFAPGCTCTQDLLLSSTSRFVGQRSFVAYKTLIAGYFLFWCIWWPDADGVSIFEYLTYWTFYVGTLCEYVAQAIGCCKVTQTTTTCNVSKQSSKSSYRYMKTSVRKIPQQGS